MRRQARVMQARITNGDGPRVRRWCSRALVVIGGAIAGTAVAWTLSTAGAHADAGDDSDSRAALLDVTGLLHDEIGVVSEVVDRARSSTRDLLGARQLRTPASLDVDDTVGQVGELIDGESRAAESAEDSAAQRPDADSATRAASDSKHAVAGPFEAATASGEHRTGHSPPGAPSSAPRASERSPAAPNAPPTPFAPPSAAPSAPAQAGGPLFVALPVSVADLADTVRTRVGTTPAAGAHRAVRPRSQPGITPD